MANVDAPFGFVPIGTTDGSDYHGKLEEVEFLATDATPAFLGDMVSLTGTTGTDGYTQVVTQATAGTGNALFGAIVEFLPDFTNEAFIGDGNNQRAANQAIKARVAVGKDVLYVAQANAALTAADAGQNAAIVVGAGDTITGISGMEIDAGTVTAATEQVRLVRGRNVVGNDPLLVDAQWVAFINEHQYDHGTGV